VSIGASILTVKGKNIKFEELFEYADKELYRAKQNGRDVLSLDGRLYT
jgi:GGDEF domain-containing protein